MNRGEHLREVKSATIQRFTELWRQNFEANLSALQRNPGITGLKNKFSNIPGIVIGAGPSLDKNIHLLRRVMGKAALIASDAALKPLLRHDVKPSFVVCLDPQDEISKFFTNVPHRDITLIAPSIVHPRVLDLWEGNVIFYHKYAPDIPVLTEIQNQIPGLGMLTPGGTVLTIAYNLAFETGANPIMFLGQDLSYPKKITYSRSSENSEEALEQTLNRLQENIVFESDVYGASLPTLKSMSVTKQWFNWAFTTWKRTPPADIINCSEAGILTDHCVWMPFSEAIFKHCNKKYNVPWIIKKALKTK